MAQSGGCTPPDGPSDEKRFPPLAILARLSRDVGGRWALLWTSREVVMQGVRHDSASVRHGALGLGGFQYAITQWRKRVERI